MKWGILGVANITNKLIPAFQQSKTGKLVAISSRSIDKAKICSEKYNIPKYYGNYRDLIRDPEIEAVYIPLPNHLHKEWTLEAASHKKHVLCEKPLAVTSQDAADMFYGSQKHGCKLMEAFMYRFDPKIEKIRKMIQDKTLGEIKYIDFNFSHPLEERLAKKNDYRLNKEYGGGAFYDLGVYGINLINYLLEDTPKEILDCKVIKNDEKDIDRTTFTKLLYPNNVVATMTVSFQFYSNYLQIAGTTGALEVSNIISQNDGELRLKKYKVLNISTEKLNAFNSYKAMIKHFNDCIINEKQPEITTEQTLGTLRMVEKILERMKKI